MKAQAPSRTGDPVATLLSLEDAKLHLRVDGSDEDGLITTLIGAATSHIDGYAGVLGRALITQTWQQKFDAFPACDRFRLPLGPLQGVTSVSYFDDAGAAQTFTSFHAMSDAIGPLVVLQDGAAWPATAVRPDAVTVTWSCGYGDAASDVPAAVIHAVKLMIADWYDRRGSEVAGVVDARVQALLLPLRAVGV